ncbi:MAG: hypothetical protein VX529_15955 [Pseudomonadota bacterium]|nr:hypothetical protein [Pseudomonadota bacterium]
MLAETTPYPLLAVKGYARFAALRALDGEKRIRPAGQQAKYGMLRATLAVLTHVSSKMRRRLSRSKVLKTLMFEQDRGLALIEVDPHTARRTADARRERFCQNLVLVDGTGELIRSVHVPPVTRMPSYLVDLKLLDGAVEITDFRGYRYAFDIATETVSRLDHIEKY